jgi:hypothetical protein
MYDRRRLTAPVLALGVSFIAVLIAGAVFGQAPVPRHLVLDTVKLEVQAQAIPQPTHTVTPPPPRHTVTPRLHRHTATPRPTVKPRTSPGPRASTRAPTAALFSGAFSGSQVAVLDARSLRLIVSSHLGPGGTFTTQVTDDSSYLVCLVPPHGWMPVPDITGDSPDWTCKVTHVGAGTAIVSFSLERLASSASGSPR